MAIIIDGTNGITENGVELGSAIANNTQSIINLAASNAQGQFGNASMSLTLSTSAQQVPFSVLTQSTNTGIFTVNANNTITISTAGTYNFVSNVIFQNLGTGGINDNVTFTVVDSTTNAVYYTQPAVSVKTGASNNVTLSFNSLITVTTVPVTVKINVQSTGADYKIVSLNSILSIQSSASLTVANLLKDTAHSFTGNGYQQLSNGLIIQWGYDSNATTTFPIAFPNACFNVTAIRYGSDGDVEPEYISSFSSTGFNYVFKSSIKQKLWKAIGY